MMNGTIRKLPVGVQDFEKLRKENNIYVDKTMVIYRLITTGCYYFLSRPRRFGKSLLITTLKALFEGKRELFDGLAIAQTDFEWVKRPVLHLDLNTNEYKTKRVLVKKLEESLSQWEKEYDCSREDLPLGMRFENVIRCAHEKTGQRVAILVDEYDKPMLQAIGKTKLQDAYRSTLKGFYGALKSMDAHIKFAIITGITRFSHVSIFSDLNNLRDISMSAQYADICGITEKELLADFGEEIDQLAEACNLSHERCIAKLKEYYDGYHFMEKSVGIYNPFSVLSTFSDNAFGSSWFRSGTPTYLVKLLRENDYNLADTSHCVVKQNVLACINDEISDPIPLLFQSGYLTIKDYDEEFETYTLGFPNREVESGFTEFLAPRYIYRKPTSAFDIRNFVCDVREGKTEQFIERLRSLFADTPYDIVKDLENHYQNIVWIIFKLMGFYTQAEYHTSRGRIDLVVKTPKYCYVMEFKLDGTAEEALQQISDKDYALPFALEDQQVIRLGINFDKQTRNIEKVVVG